MRYVERRTLDGGTVTLRVPETEAEERQLARKGALESFEEFLHPTPANDADDPLLEDWERRRRHRRRRRGRCRGRRGRRRGRSRT